MSRLLANRQAISARSSLVIALLVMAGGNALLWGVSVGAFISAMSFLVALLAGAFARQAYLVGREQGIANAKLLAVVIAVQAAALALVSVQSLLTGDNPLPGEGDTVALVATIVVGVLASVNNGLFVALVLNIYVKRLQAARAEALALESERSRLAERERLLAEMHDGLGSQLASAKIRFERGAITTQQAGEVLQECVTDLHLLVDTLRAAVTISRPRSVTFVTAWINGWRGEVCTSLGRSISTGLLGCLPPWCLICCVRCKRRSPMR